MKTSQNTILADVRNIATSGSNPIDFRIEDNQIIYWIDQMRATFISQALQKGQDISDIWLQPITCLELIQVDISECCNTDTGCKVLRTNLQLPHTIETRGDNSIVRVEDSSGKVISKTNAFEAKYNEDSKYTSIKPKWLLKNKYIYILNSDFLSKINVIGLWENPSELINYSNCDNTRCFDPDSEYPCSNKMAEQITDIILKKKIYPFIQLPQDTTNDSSGRFDSPPSNNMK